MTTKRYRVGLDIRTYTRKLIKSCLVCIISTATIMLIGFGLLYGPSISAMKDSHADEIIRLTEEHQQEIDQLNITYNKELDEQKAALDKRYIDDTAMLTAEIDTLSTNLASTQMSLDRIKANSEEDFNLLRKYWYVFERTGDNSGLTTDVIRHVDQTCKEWDVNPHWMWAIYWEESNFRAAIDNTAGSGARGLGQVMPSTGKSFWENILGHGAGSFTTDMLYDPYVNVDITVAIIGRHLSNGWTMYQAINQYSGGGGNGYFNEVLATGKTHGVTLDDSNWHYPKE